MDPPGFYARQCASFVALQAALTRFDAQIPGLVLIVGFVVLLALQMKSQCGSLCV